MRGEYAMEQIAQQGALFEDAVGSAGYRFPYRKIERIENALM